MRRTPVMIDQKDPWRMLADAIVLQAVKDYRSRIRLMKRIRKQMRKRDISKEGYGRTWSFGKRFRSP